MSVCLSVCLSVCPARRSNIQFLTVRTSNPPTHPHALYLMPVQPHPPPYSHKTVPPPFCIVQYPSQSMQLNGTKRRDKIQNGSRIRKKFLTSGDVPSSQKCNDVCQHLPRSTNYGTTRVDVSLSQRPVCTAVSSAYCCTDFLQMTEFRRNM